MIFLIIETSVQTEQAVPGPYLMYFLCLQLLTGNVHAGIQESGHLLLIENAMLSHEGQYTCVVTNTAGEDKRDFRVTIQGVFAKICVFLFRIMICYIEFSYFIKMQVCGIKKNLQLNEGDLTQTCSCLMPVPPIFHRVTNREAAWGLGHEDDDKEDMVKKLEVVLSHPISLSCESNAIPPPKLSWYKDGRKLTSGNGVVLLPGKRELLLCDLG